MAASKPTDSWRRWACPTAGTVLRVTGIPTGWFLQGALAGTRDISVDPIDLEGDVTGVRLLFTDRPANLSGVVTTPAGAPDEFAVVVAFPVDPAAWLDRGPFPRRLRSARTTRDGAFSIADLPPGTYLVAAVSHAASADWQTPEFLAALARAATRVEITAGEARQVSLQTTKGGS